MELSGRAHLREWRRGAPLTWLDHNTERKNTHTRTPTPYDMQSPIPAIHPRSSWFWPTRREMSGVSPPALSYATSGDISSPDGSWFCVCRRKLLVIPHERRCQNLKIARLSGYEKIIPRFVGMRKRPDGTSCGSLSFRCVRELFRWRKFHRYSTHKNCLTKRLGTVHYSRRCAKKNKELSLSLPTLFIGRGRKPANENKKRGLSDLIKLR